MSIFQQQFLLQKQYTSAIYSKQVYNRAKENTVRNNDRKPNAHVTYASLFYTVLPSIRA